MRSFSAHEVGGLLSRRYPGSEVLSLEVDKLIPGTATKLRVRLQYNAIGREQGLPDRLWIKGGLQGQDASFDPLYANEARFYREIAPLLQANCARSYFESAPVEVPLLLLEDLDGRGARYGDPGETLNLAQAQHVLDLQARFHAALWGERLRDFVWLGDSSATFERLILGWTEPEHWSRQLALPRAAAIDTAISAGTVRTGLFAMLETDRRGPQCLIHGDTHVGNLFFEPDGAIGYLDWQTAMRGHWAHDVAEFLITALTVRQRRSAEEMLLRHYLKRLQAYGGPVVAFDTAWLAYRQHAAWGFMWILCPPELQAEPVCILNAERAYAAIRDFAVWSLL